MKSKRFNVLYVDAVGPFGGASRSLFELVRLLEKEGRVRSFFLKQVGTSSHFYRKISKHVTEVLGLPRFDHTGYGFYRGFRWIILLREMAYIPFLISVLLTCNSKYRNVDLIHVNEVTDVLTGWMLSKILRKPLIIHVRSIQNDKIDLMRTHILHFFLRNAAHVIAIDENVRSSIPQNTNVSVVHNSFTVENYPVKAHYPNNFDIDNPLLVGFVGNLQKAKGVLDLLAALRILLAQGVHCRLLMVGSDISGVGRLFEPLLKGLNLSQSVKREVLSEYTEWASDYIELVGHQIDISLFYQRMNLLVFPSHFNAPGRPVFEAAFFGVPSIICCDNPNTDTFVNLKTGLSACPRNPDSLAETIYHFYENPSEIQRMGDNARELAEKNHVAPNNAAKVLNIYQDVLSKEPIISDL